jgi:hypothetical protein
VKSKQAHFAHLSSAQRWVVLACLLLMAITVATQALHSHAYELSSEARHCTICQVAHTTVQATAVAQLVLSSTSTVFLSLSADPDPKQGLDTFSLFSRPPPTV